jgi:hypothetical protein
VQRIDMFQLYKLGAALRSLSGMGEQSTVNGSMGPIFFSSIELQQLIHSKLIPLRVGLPSVSELYREIGELTAGLGSKDVDQSNFDKPLGWKATRIGNLVRTMETVLSAELAQLDIYLVPQKGIYSTNELIERCENLFPEEVRKWMTAEAVRDIHEAGRCLAFNVPTAGAFHITRAVEAVMARYWEYVTGRKKEELKDGQRTMGSLIRALTEEKVDAKILAVLDQIRELHRNPTMHPDSFFTEGEVLALLGVAQSAIIVMTTDMEKREAAPKNTIAPRPNST